MKTIIKNLGLTTMLLCSFFVYSSLCSFFVHSNDLIVQTSPTETSQTSELITAYGCINDDSTFYIQSTADSVIQGASIDFLMYHPGWQYSTYDYTLRDINGSTITATVGSSPYFTMNFNVPPGTYIVSAAYLGGLPLGNGPCSGEKSKYITVTSPY